MCSFPASFPAYSHLSFIGNPRLFYSLLCDTLSPFYESGHIFSTLS